MVNERHLMMLKRNIEDWNKWREKNPRVRPDFIRASLEGSNLLEANLSKANFIKANLSRAYLIKANLSRSNLYKANLEGANLYRADLSKGYLISVKFPKAYLTEANFEGTNLVEGDLAKAHLVLEPKTLSTPVIGKSRARLRGNRPLFHIIRTMLRIRTPDNPKHRFPDASGQMVRVPDGFMTAAPQLVCLSRAGVHVKTARRSRGRAPETPLFADAETTRPEEREDERHL